MKRALIALPLLLTLACASTDPAVRFAELESRLLDRDLEVIYDATASGAVTMTSKGTLRIEGNSVSLGDTRVTGAEAKRAVVIGWTRMGLMHNLNRIHRGLSIDRAEGGVDEWVRTANVYYDPVERSFTFDILMASGKVADAHLWLDAKGRPLRRIQTVSFPGGKMYVEESYTWR